MSVVKAIDGHVQHLGVVALGKGGLAGLTGQGKELGQRAIRSRTTRHFLRG